MDLQKLENLKILYVEDEAIVQKAIGGMLTDIVKEVILASDGKEALEKMEQHKDLDLIITDIQMPNMNGVEFSKQVRANGKDIPIIAITAFDNSTPIINNNAIGSDIGIDKYIQKPADIDDIINAMIEILE